MSAQPCASLVLYKLFMEGLACGDSWEGDPHLEVVHARRFLAHHTLYRVRGWGRAMGLRWASCALGLHVNGCRAMGDAHRHTRWLAPWRWARRLGIPLNRPTSLEKVSRLVDTGGELPGIPRTS